MKTLKLDRRTFLGGAIALPFLEAMLPRRAVAQMAVPKRYVVCFAGMSLGRDNAGKLSDIVPDIVGAGYDLKTPLAPLAQVKDEVTVVSGLQIPIGGPGGRLGGFHKSSLSPLLSGTLPPSTSPNCAGPTSDQIVASSPGYAGKTKIPFMSLRVQADAYRGGGNVGVISWKDKGQKNDPTVSPSLAFKNAFTGLPAAGGMADPAGEAARKRALKEEASVLDAVRGSADRLMKRLGREDRARLERHLDEIRALEARLAGIPFDGAPGASTCGAPARPGADPATVVADGIGYAGEEERAKVMTGVIAKSFACDLTRVATLQFTCAQSFMNVDALVGVKMDLHELAHLSTIQGGKDVAQQKVMQMYGWHMKHFAALVSQLKGEIGPDGRPVLDHTALVFVNEGGLGPADGKNPSSHSTDNMMVIVAGGKALGLKPGRHVKGGNQHPAKVVLGAMQAAGVQGNALGQVNGRFEGLFGSGGDAPRVCADGGRRTRAAACASPHEELWDDGPSDRRVAEGLEPELPHDREKALLHEKRGNPRRGTFVVCPSRCAASRRTRTSSTRHLTWWQRSSPASCGSSRGQRSLTRRRRRRSGRSWGLHSSAAAGGRAAGFSSSSRSSTSARTSSCLISPGGGGSA